MKGVKHQFYCFVFEWHSQIIEGTYSFKKDCAAREIIKSKYSFKILLLEFSREIIISFLILVSNFSKNLSLILDF